MLYPYQTDQLVPPLKKLNPAFLKCLGHNRSFAFEILTILFLFILICLETMIFLANSSWFGHLIKLDWHSQRTTYNSDTTRLWEVPEVFWSSRRYVYVVFVVRACLNRFIHYYHSGLIQYLVSTAHLYFLF